MQILEELYKKYNVVLDGKRRTYEYSLNQKKFDLEYTSPISFKFGNDIFYVSTWSELLVNLVNTMIEFFPKDKRELLDFKTNWSNAYFFSDEKKINHLKLNNNLFLNVNNTSLHSCWLLIDLLSFFGVDLNLCKLTIHRLPRAEPEELKKAIKEITIEEFKYYLQRFKLLSEKDILKVIKNIAYLNDLFKKRSSGYNDLYLFDNANIFNSIKYKFLSEFAKLTKDYSKNYALGKKYLDYLSDFYRDNGYYYRNS